jgi:cysteinyl-tRNA synthetase
LELYNTLSRKIEPFTSRKEGEVKLYACGPSLYREPHIGNYRTFLFQDILQRHLECLGYKVTRLITLTDIEDKAIDEANKEEVNIAELTQRISDIFFSELRLLRIKHPTYSPRSSTTVEQSVKIIQALLDKGLAYWHSYRGARNVYFDPLRFKSFGKLSNLDMSRWPKVKKRFHKDNYPGSPWNRGDFILWHGNREGDTVYWETDIGKGRPAWNVQDAGMITQHLGSEIDIACGGIDNLVRHHDYTISIIEGISEKEFSNYWLHGGHLLVDGKKMSKSKGNVYYPKDLTSRGYEMRHLRFFLIFGDYKRSLNFTFEKMERARQRLDKFRIMVSDLENADAEETDERAKKLIGDTLRAYEENLNRNLDVKSAFNEVFMVVSKLDKLRRRNLLSKQEARVAVTNLRTIDETLQVIF